MWSMGFVREGRMGRAGGCPDVVAKAPLPTRSASCTTSLSGPRLMRLDGGGCASSTSGMMCTPQVLLE